MNQRSVATHATGGALSSLKAGCRREVQIAGSALSFSVANESDMPWTLDRYPASMRNLAPPVRAKAIEIANALLEEGLDEGLAIRIAIAKAKLWAERHATPTDRSDRFAR